MLSATGIASAIHMREVRAREVVAMAIERISTGNNALNCFTTVLADRAMADADAVDKAIAGGYDPGPLAGVPFAVKNLYDVAGFTTLAGAKITRENPPAERDAVAIRLLKKAGAILVGMLNMDEFAFGWTTENSHYGTSRNPHDHSRTPGGSSGGAGAVVGAGFVPLALGSDTNGSIRVPAAFCGVFGLKPTYGLLSRAGMMLLAPSLDHAGPLAGSAVDLAAAYEALRKWDDEDPEVRTPAVRLNGTIGDLRIGVASEEFGEAIPEAWSAVEVIARALSVNRRVRIPEVDRARAAASLITASEAAAGHLPALRFRAKDFDPLIRDRLLAAALLPATTYLQAQRFRAWFRSQLLAIFRDIDILITPTTPCFPPLLGAAGVDTTTKLSIGRFTQPFSLVGLPVISVPVKSATTLPLGVQLISAPFHEDGLLQLAAHLETTGVVSRWPLPPDIM